MQTGDKVRFKGGLITGHIVDTLWYGKYYVEWADGCFTVVSRKDIERAE